MGAPSGHRQNLFRLNFFKSVKRPKQLNFDQNDQFFLNLNPFQKILDQVDLIKIKKKNKIGSTRLEPNPGKKHIGSIDFPELIQRAGTFFADPCPLEISCNFRKFNFYTMFRMRLGRKISLGPKFRKIKFKEITGNQFQGTFSTLAS